MMKTTVKPLIVSVLLLSSSLILAQDPFNPGEDPGVSPINDYLIPMIVLGIVLGFFLIKKKKTA
jgi:hypothetical protein